MYPNVDYASFLLRIWREPVSSQSDPPPAWRGQVMHIQSSESWEFHTLDDLQAFLAQRAGQICRRYVEVTPELVTQVTALIQEVMVDKSADKDDAR